MMRIKRLLRRSIDGLIRASGYELHRRGVTHYPDATDGQRMLTRKYSRYTMTSELRQWTLLRAVDYIDRAGVPGDIVECGVWRGGNIMMIKEYRIGQPMPRRLYLFDTFAGMPEPSDIDASMDGVSAKAIHRRHNRGEHSTWAYASLDEVKRNFERHGLLDQDVVFRKGLVEDTLRDGDVPDRIGLLRLDTDWYESTRVELDVLFPRLVAGGVLIIDDYGTWRGATAATDEYFATRPVLLIAIDRGCRVAIKTH